MPCLSAQCSIPFFKLIETNSVWSSNAGFLLSPLPLQHLFVHQDIYKVLSSVQELIQAKQRSLDPKDKHEKGDNTTRETPISFCVSTVSNLPALVEFVDK